MMMRTINAGRPTVTVMLLALLSSIFLIVPGSQEALANEDVRACLSRESGEFFQKLAVAVASSAVEAAKIDDGFIAQGTDGIIATCKGNPASLSEADEASFREYMTKWPEHLDRRLSAITRAGASD